MSLELKIKKETLQDAIIKVSCALGDKNDAITTKNFGFEAKDGKLIIKASRSEVSAKVEVLESDDMEIISEGEFVLDGYSLMGDLPNFHSKVELHVTVDDGDDLVDESEMEDEDSSTKIVHFSYKKQTGGVWNHEFSTLNDKYKPAVNFDWESDHSVSYPASLLIDNVNKTAYAASDNDYRASYNIVLIDMGPDGIVFFASDGRQSAYVKDDNFKFKSSKSALISSKIISSISQKKIFSADSEVSMSIADNPSNGCPRIKFEQDNLVVISNFYENATRLPYEKIIGSSDSECEFTINPSCLKEDLNAITKQDLKETMWRFTSDKIFITNISYQGKKTEGEIDCVENFSGSPCELKFSLRYWENIISRSSNENLKVSVRKKKPTEIHVSSQPVEYKFFIQPIYDTEEYQ
jgi:DNA polymerase III sliding clamp (beta) subunit (PCNA family)